MVKDIEHQPAQPPIEYGELEKQLKFIDIVGTTGTSVNKDLSMRYDIKTAVMIMHYDTFKTSQEYRNKLEHNYGMCYALGNRKYTDFMKNTFYMDEHKALYLDIYK